MSFDIVHSNFCKYTLIRCERHRKDSPLNPDNETTIYIAHKAESTVLFSAGISCSKWVRRSYNLFLHFTISMRFITQRKLFSGRGTSLRRYNRINRADTVFVHHRQRWSALVQTFVKEFGGSPNYIVRAPGRVNVLGEHIDYSLFVSIVKGP